MTQTLRVHDLSVSLPGAGAQLDVARDVDLSLCSGEVLCLVGESGCGKTSTALALTALLPEGSNIAFKEITFEGKTARTAADLAAWRGRGIAHIFQEASAHLDPLLPVGAQIRETLRVVRGLDRYSAEAETQRLLDRVGLTPSKTFSRFYPHQLSGGMNQRVLIAAALACAPRVLIADEPTTGLDPARRRDIAGLIKGLAREEDWAILWITHDISLAQETADRVAVMYAGRIVEEGPREAVFTRPLHPYTQALLSCRPGRQDTRRLPDIPGDIADFRALPSGCAFHPRCVRRLERCDREVPKISLQPNGQCTRCFLQQNT